jgi:D-alanyl-D-alanine carboxypeptidase/D-alanyl-D-alanine carboxypeptidase (penicillin-binding protein 5/6)
MMGILLLTMSIAMQCCSAKEGPVLSEEEKRVAASQHIDSTQVPRDSIAERELMEHITAEAWMLVEDSSGCLVSAKNAHQRMYPASLTKMMTCLLVLEKGNMGDSVIATNDVCLTKDSRVRPGDGYLMKNLLYEMMLQSDNNAACALAKHISGDIPAFCQLMNEKAAYLGLDSTHFANPNGMPAPDNYSTASDLVRLARYAMRDSLFAAIVGTVERKVPMTDGRHMDCYNTNQLLSTYEGCLGVKTGYTRQAGYCLASAATRNGRTLYCVLLNSRSLRTRFTESAILLDYGFRIVKSEE